MLLMCQKAILIVDKMKAEWLLGVKHLGKKKSDHQKSWNQNLYGFEIILLRLK